MGFKRLKRFPLGEINLAMFLELALSNEIQVQAISAG